MFHLKNYFVVSELNSTTYKTKTQLETYPEFHLEGGRSREKKL